MLNRLTDLQKEKYKGFCDFVQEYVEPFAGQWDKDGGVPREIIERCAREGYVGGIIPEEYGGGGWDTVTFGLLNEAMGAAASSLCVLFTVQTMVAMTLAKWGTPEQCQRWLPPMAKGDIIGAFAMTEPKVGSEIQAVETNFTPKGETYLLNGTKKWITFSGMADVFLIFGKEAGSIGKDKSMACIVRSDAPGVTVTRIDDMMGFKGAYLSEIQFDNCEIPQEDLLGKPGLVLNYVAPYGLHYGRISTSWSAAGLLRGCLKTSSTFSRDRLVGGKPIIELGMIREMITKMGVDMDAARQLCLNGSVAVDTGMPDAMDKVLIAKYFASRAAVRAASDTVQIMGAAGCREDQPAARFYRDSKITQIIEGTEQVLQKVLGKRYCQKYADRKQ